MDSKQYNIAINIEKPLRIDLTNGNMKIISHDGAASAEIEYRPFGTITPELKFEEKKQNVIKFENSEIVETNVVLYIPHALNELEAVINKGNLVVTPGSGTYDLQVYNGGIKVDTFKGDLRVNSLNGEIKINDCDGKIDIQSTNGAIKIIDWKCSGGTLESNSGQVLISLKELTKDLEVQAKNGVLILGVDPKLKSTIIARGTDVLDYQKKPNGDSLGSPAKIETNGGGHQIKLFSRTNKVKVAYISQLDQVAPDFEKWFDELETEIRQSLDFDKLMHEMKDIGKKMEDFGRKFAKNIQDAFNQTGTKKNGGSKPPKDDQGGSPSVKMEILTMLKEGKISAEEAEKLLKAL